MKCNTFYEDLCSSSCFKSEGAKKLNASHTMAVSLFVEYKSTRDLNLDILYR